MKRVDTVIQERTSALLQHTLLSVFYIIHVNANELRSLCDSRRMYSEVTKNMVRRTTGFILFSLFLIIGI